MVDEAHSLGTFGRTGLGCAEDQGVLDEVDFVVGTFSKSLAGIGGVCVSNHPELRALHFLARAYVFTASGSPSNIASVSAAVKVVRAHPELRDQLWANVRRLRQGLRELGYVIGETESPIVPIMTGDETRTIALWQRLLSEGLYVNLIVPPGCPGGRVRPARQLLGRAQPRNRSAARSTSSAASAPSSASPASRCRVDRQRRPTPIPLFHQPSRRYQRTRPRALRADRSPRRRRGDRAADRRGRRTLPTRARRSAGC